VPHRVADQSAGTLAREAARRRVVDTLRLTASIAEYSARALANGLSPEQARQATLDVAAELEHIAAKLRRLTRTARLDPDARRALVADLAASGWSQRRIAEAVGTHKRSVWNDLHDRP
jgi:DNA-directed RNA polymerase specialized sigma24 family protein